MRIYLKTAFTFLILACVSAVAGEIKCSGDDDFSICSAKFNLTNRQDNSAAHVSFTRSGSAKDSFDYVIQVSRSGTNYLQFKNNSLKFIADNQEIQTVDTDPTPPTRYTDKGRKSELNGFEFTRDDFLKICQAKKLDMRIDGEKGSSVYEVNTTLADTVRAEYVEFLAKEPRASGKNPPSNATTPKNSQTP